VEVEGFEMVKLGDIAEWQMGKRIVKDQVETGKYPVYGGGGITFYTNSSNRSDINCKISREGMSEANCVLMISGDYHQNSQGMTVVSKDTGKVLNSYLWNWLVVHKKDVYECGQGTAQKAINMVMLNDLDVPLPSLERQAQIVEAIDGWASLAQQEEVALKILEKQMMFQVKEMGRGQVRVKLGEVIKKVKSGKTNSTEASGSGEYNFYGCTAKVPTNTHSSYDFEGDEYLLFAKSGGNAKTKVGENLGIGKFHYVTGKTAGNIAVFQYNVNSTIATCQFTYYLLKTKLEEIQLLADYTTGNGNINIELVYNTIELQLPPLTEQQTLQSDFDEIRHKHAKIAEYKAKAQAAIQRLIPGAA
jgi:restriction endonuclease S subunit